MIELFPVAVVVLLFGSTAIVRLVGERHPALSVSIARLAIGIALGVSVAMATVSGRAGSGALLVADRLGSTVSVFVVLMAAIVGAFASRSLAVDPRAPRFFAWSNALVGSTIALALADRPWLMAASWVAVSVSVVALIGFDGRRASIVAARRAARVFVLGDLAVVAGCALATVTSKGSDGSIKAVAEAVGSARSWLTVGVGVALVIGALVRSAQLPFSGWLAASVEAPTPVSAMLHAGVVNGSAILLIRWHAALSSSILVTVLTISVAVAGVVAGMAVGRTRPDVKSGLAWTTVAQMGFMTLQCALGLAGVAVVHLIAHGMFKASLFLGAGTGLDSSGTHRHPAQIRPSVRVVALAGAAATIVVGSAFALVRPAFLLQPAAVVPVAFSWAAIAYGLAQWWIRVDARSPRSLTVPVALTTAGFAALAAISSMVDGWLGEARSIGAPDGARWLAVAAVAAVGVAWITGVIVPRRFPTLAARAWMWFSAPTAPLLRRKPTGHLPSSLSRRLGSSADPARRARIRSTITRAASSLPQARPLERFVAQNPLGDLESLPIETAAVHAAVERGVRAEWDEETYRSLHREGRITDGDLREAITDHLGASGEDPSPEDAAVARVRHELLSATAVHLPTSEPILLSEWHDVAVGTRWAERIDELSSWWCATYLSDHPAWAMPGRDHGLGTAWRSLAPHDARLIRLNKLNGSAFANVLATLPERDDDALMQLLVDVGVDRPDHEAYLRRHLSRRHGWVGALINEDGVDGDDVIGYLVIRLAIEAALFTNSADRAVARRAEASHQSNGSPDEPPVWRLTVWRDAYERGFRDRLLSSTQDLSPGHAVRQSSQAVFCMDPRSEGMRRQLESLSECETIGYAGFFGLPINVTDLDSPTPAPSCPIIVEPTATFLEVNASANAPTRADRLAMDHAAHDVFSTVKRSTTGPFALAESMGWVSGPWMAARTLVPHATARLASIARGRLLPEAETSMGPKPDDRWNTDDEVAIAASILRTTGLDRSPAPLVLLCGHGSHHVNNLHRSALQCGACGGRAGANNARVAATLLNDPNVRSRLLAAGISVPDDTWFVAAEHDTTSDRVHVFDRNAIPASHLPVLAQLESDLAEAGRRLAAERGDDLPGTVGRRLGGYAVRVQRRGADWAQVVPEYGLVGNAAVIIGPRSLTREVDLERRVFLHSYQPEHDPDGDVLAAILAGPLVVAHGINAQYRLSTIDPDRLGAGTKTAHNLVGGVGVVEGAGGDLRVGLPLESVSSAGTTIHDPMRLLVIIDAPTYLVERALTVTEAVAQLARNGWIHIAARPADLGETTTQWALRSRDGSWRPWSSLDTASQVISVKSEEPSSIPPDVLV